VLYLFFRETIIQPFNSNMVSEGKLFRTGHSRSAGSIVHSLASSSFDHDSSR
jgi:hypothetical protein